MLCKTLKSHDFDDLWSAPKARHISYAMLYTLSSCRVIYPLGNVYGYVHGTLIWTQGI